MKRLILLGFALACAALAGCTLSLGLTNSPDMPNLPSGPPRAGR